VGNAGNAGAISSATRKSVFSCARYEFTNTSEVP